MDPREIEQRIVEALWRTDPDMAVRWLVPDGRARTASWHCEDDSVVEYTTERIRGGNLNPGKFAVLLFEPQGKGSRKRVRGSAERWVRTRVWRCDTRTEAKEIAVREFRSRSPKWDAKHPVRERSN